MLFVYPVKVSLSSPPLSPHWPLSGNFALALSRHVQLRVHSASGDAAAVALAVAIAV